MRSLNLLLLLLQQFDLLLNGKLLHYKIDQLVHCCIMNSHGYGRGIIDDGLETYGTVAA
jgi:hypothetical protein